MYLSKIPAFVKWFYPKEVLWKKVTSNKEVFLTFDDGPIPEVTPRVLDLLDHYGVKASFFMVGENAQKHPELVKEVVQRGHRIGNHSYNHLKGWESSNQKYFDNIAKAAAHIPSDLFRPPHGQIKLSQTKMLKLKYQIVMWTILSGDYDYRKSPEECFENVRRNICPGAIIVFHDSLKAEKNMFYALEESIKWLQKEAYRFALL